MFFGNVQSARSPSGKHPGQIGRDELTLHEHVVVAEDREPWGADPR